MIDPIQNTQLYGSITKKNIEYIRYGLIMVMYTYLTLFKTTSNLMKDPIMSKLVKDPMSCLVMTQCLTLWRQYLTLWKTISKQMKDPTSNLMINVYFCNDPMSNLMEDNI